MPAASSEIKAMENELAAVLPCTRSFEFIPCTMNLPARVDYATHC